MVKIVCKKGDNIYTLSVSTAIIEEAGAVEVYGIIFWMWWKITCPEYFRKSYHLA